MTFVSKWLRYCQVHGSPEFRVDYGPGYRLYFTRRGLVFIVMLNAGDKSSQRRDIRRALKIAADIGVSP